MQSDFLSRNTFPRGGVLGLSRKVKGPLISGKATHSPRRRSPACGPWGCSANQGLLSASLGGSSCPRILWSWMMPLEKADHQPFQSEAGYTFPRQGENQEAWAVPNPEVMFFPRKCELAYSCCLPSARVALKGAGVTSRSANQVWGSCALPVPGAAPHAPSLTRRAWLPAPAEAIRKGTQQRVLQGQQAPPFRIFMSQLLCFAPKDCLGKNKHNLLLRSIY